jgi:hypothetical protein
MQFHQQSSGSIIAGSSWSKGARGTQLRFAHTGTYLNHPYPAERMSVSFCSLLKKDF